MSNIVQATPIDREIDIFDKSLFIMEIDREGKIIYANRRYLTVLGFSEGEIIGSEYELLWHPDMPKGAMQGMWKITSDNKIWRGYLKHLAKDGSYFWTLSYMHAKLDDEGNVIGYSSTGKVAHQAVREEVEMKYKELSDDIDNSYFMASESYYDTQILPQTYFR